MACYAGEKLFGGGGGGMIGLHWIRDEGIVVVDCWAVW